MERRGEGEGCNGGAGERRGQESSETVWGCKWEEEKREKEHKRNSSNEKI